jgi:hypothetical protein
MKTTKSFIFLFSAAALFVSCAGCTEPQHPNRAYFHIPTSDRKMMIAVQLNDTLTSRSFSFDTGVPFLYLDSTFFFTHNLAPDASPINFMEGTYKSLTSPQFALTYNVPTSVKVGETTVKYDRLNVRNFKEWLRNDAIEGTVGIPFLDTTHVWEVNFEHSYIEVHAAADFQMPERCMLFPLIRDEKTRMFSIQIPLRIVCEGDTLSCSRTYIIDTGDPADITIASPAEEMDFFNRHPDAATWFGLGGWYTRRYTVNATAWDSFSMDSLRIYTFERGVHSYYKYMVGFNFLKRFNVFFDLKNQQIGLLPIKFERVANPGWRVFHYQSPLTADGAYKITVMGEYKKNYFKTAGLQVGDEIVMVNDSLYKNVMNSYSLHEQLWSSDTLRFDILRNGQPLRVVVPVDKSEQQGD